MMLHEDAVKKDTKLVLLFQPGELLKKYAVLHLLQINREGGKIDYTVSVISRKEMERHWPTLPNAAKELLCRFQPEQIAAVLKETELRHKKQKAGVPLPAFLKQSALRHLYRQFNELKPYFSSLKCYHKISKPGNQAIQTLPCVFLPEKPALRFVVKQEGRLYTLNTEIGIGSNYSDACEFTRTAFFLQRNNQYFLLSFADYQLLEWLEANIGNGLEQTVFIEKILTRLEGDYAVNRNGLLDEKMVETKPRCRVYLSELNNAFLLLTPQWLYEGVLVEGAWKERQEVTLGGERIVIQRNRETEEEFLQLLSSFHHNFPGQRNGYYYLSFADAQKKQWFIKTYYALLEGNVEIVGMDMLHHFRYSPHQAETTETLLQEEGSRMRLQMTVRFGKEQVSLATLQKTLHAGQRAVVLKDGSLGVLSDEWLAKYATILKHGRLQEGDLLVSKFISFGEQEQTEGSPSGKEEWRRLWYHWQSQQGPLYPVPDAVKANLRPYQQKGFEWLALLSQLGAGACLADDMGLGKTLQTICFLAWYSRQHPTAKHLIVCPTSLLYNWQDEMKKFAPGLCTTVYHASGGYSLNPEAGIIITSYGTIRNNSETLLTHSFGVVVIDESHNIKNPAAQITRTIQEVQADFRIALSGTPVVNNTFDLYSQLSFVLPGLLGSREFFRREYADAIDRYGEEAKMEKLRSLTAPFILRRTKEQVATDLPSKTETVLWCTMGASQEALYNKVKEQVRSRLLPEIQTNGLQKSKLAVLQGLLKLRQICNHPLLLPAEELDGRLDSTKTEVLFEELANLLGRHRVLLFSQFSSMLQLLAGECDRKGIAYFLLDGQTPAARRMQMVREFQENTEAPHLFFISLKAGNTGLTLTSADYVFLFDPWWNTAVEQQAVDRTHRIGQTKNVFSYKLVCKNTIEEKILDLQQRKKHLAEELITPEEDFVKKLSEEEIAYLLE